MRSWLEARVLVLLLRVRALSLSNLVAIARRSDDASLIDSYVVLLAGFLTVLLFFCRPAEHPWLSVFPVLRLLDIVDYQLCLALIDSQVRGWRVQSVARSFILAFVNLYEIVAGYAVLYLSLGMVVKNDPIHPGTLG